MLKHLLVEEQAFAESQDYGVYGERVRKACWGYLCRGGAIELREVSSSYHCLVVVVVVCTRGEGNGYKRECFGINENSHFKIWVGPCRFCQSFLRKLCRNY